MVTVRGTDNVLQDLLRCSELVWKTLLFRNERATHSDQSLQILLSPSEGRTNVVLFLVMVLVILMILWVITREE